MLLLDVNNSEINAPALGSRFTLKLNSDEAYELNRLRTESLKSPLKYKRFATELDDSDTEMEKKYIPKEMTLNNLRFELAGWDPVDKPDKNDLTFTRWTLIKVGKYEVIFHEEDPLPK